MDLKVAYKEKIKSEFFLFSQVYKFNNILFFYMILMLTILGSAFPTSLLGFPHIQSWKLNLYLLKDVLI